MPTAAGLVDGAVPLWRWASNGSAAIFRPVDAGWRAMVHNRVVYGKSHARWHVAVCDPCGTCKDVTVRSRLTDARLYAERRIRDEDALTHHQQALTVAASTALLQFLHSTKKTPDTSTADVANLVGFGRSHPATWSSPRTRGSRTASP